MKVAGATISIEGFNLSLDDQQALESIFQGVSAQITYSLSDIPTLVICGGRDDLMFALTFSHHRRITWSISSIGGRSPRQEGEGVEAFCKAMAVVPDQGSLS